LALVAATLIACTLCLPQDNVVQEELWKEGQSPVEAKSYHGHQLVRFVVQSESDKATFDDVVEAHGLDVWDEEPGSHALVRVPPTVDLRKVPLSHEIIAEDLAPMLMQEVKAAGDSFHQKYHSAAEVEAFARDLAKRFPKVVTVETLGKSVDGRPIVAVHVAAQKPSPATPVVFVQAGQHAREWIAPAATLFALESAAKQAQQAEGLSGYSLTVVPLLNPDGYQHTIDKDRMWRKNRAKYKMPPYKPKPFESPAVAAANRLGQGDCSGVDLNRNWTPHWGKVLKHGQVVANKPDPCSETFMGFHEMAEPEIRAVSTHVVAKQDKVKAFLDVHSFSQRLLPPGCNGYPVPDVHAKEHLRAGKSIVAAMSKVGATYTTGACAKKMYSCAGTAADWAYMEANILHSYTVELRPSNKAAYGNGANGFVTPPEKISATGEELLAGIEALAKETMAHLELPLK